MFEVLLFLVEYGVYIKHDGVSVIIRILIDLLDGSTDEIHVSPGNLLMYLWYSYRIH